jgi:hypothetical protein
MAFTEIGAKSAKKVAVFADFGTRQIAKIRPKYLIPMYLHQTMG